MSKPIRLTVSWGNDVAVDLTIFSAAQWKKIADGHAVTINGKGYFYEGERFQDIWHFSGGLDGELRVSYDEGDGFVGTARGTHSKSRPRKATSRQVACRKIGLPRRWRSAHRRDPAYTVAMGITLVHHLVWWFEKLGHEVVSASNRLHRTGHEA